MKNELTNVNMGLNVLSDEYILEEIKTIEECQRALDIEYRRREYYENKGVVLVEEEIKETIPSYEVAKMMSKKHYEVLKMIQGSSDRRGIIQVLNDAQMDVVEYFIKSTYVDVKGEERICYECTKLGCDMLANKMTGDKGILFTAKYVKRFNEMKRILETNSMDSYMIENKIQRATKWIREQESHEYKQCLERINTLEQLKINLTLSHSDKTYTTTELAKELNFTSAKALNKELEERKIQYKINGTWVLSSKYSDKGYVESKQKILDNGHIIYFTKWTEEGRRWIIDLLSND